MNPYLDRLQPYPFEKLAALKRDLIPPADLSPIVLSIGEPRQPTPAFIRAALHAHLDELAHYPSTRGLPEWRHTIAAWLTRRFRLAPGVVDPERHVLPVNGTREALFACAQALIDPRRPARVLMPNPFYQIYEGAALLAGAQPVYIECPADQDFQPDFAAVPDRVWRECQLLYLCSPGNPTGAVLDLERLQWLLEQAQRHDFIIAADECYSELYPDETRPPPGLLQAAAALGLDDFRRCLVFHSLSKRSSAPGLRSGFVAGDARLIARFLSYRTYHGCAMPLPQQRASIAAWSDEQHVIDNRQHYRERFAAVGARLAGVLASTPPAGGFYLWARTPGDEVAFTRGLFTQQHVTVLPGRFLSRAAADGRDPGRGFVRIALVAPLAECIEAAERIRAYVATI